MSDSFAVEVFDPSLLMTNLGTVRRHIPADKVMTLDPSSYLSPEEDENASGKERSWADSCEGRSSGSGDFKLRSTLFHRMFYASPTLPTSTRSVSPKSALAIQQQQHQQQDDGKESSYEWNCGGRVSGGPPSYRSSQTSPQFATAAGVHEHPEIPAPVSRKPTILRVILTAGRRLFTPAAVPRDAQCPVGSIHARLQPSSPVVLISSPGPACGIGRTRSDGDIFGSRSGESPGTPAERSDGGGDDFRSAAASASPGSDGRDSGYRSEAGGAQDPQWRASFARAKELAKWRAGEEPGPGDDGDNKQGPKTARAGRRFGASSPRIFMQIFESGGGGNEEPDRTNESKNKIRRSRSFDRMSARMNRSNSECSLAEKYGRCQEVLGKGAHAVVHLAQNKTGEKLYAVKRFRKRHKDETPKEYIKKLTAEFCIASVLRHENVCETVDLIQDEDSLWCEIMEYCPGGDLLSRIKAEQLNSLERDCYFKQLINGIAYLHSVGVAHRCRDIKPENLLLDASGHILKIADFGISEVFKTAFSKESRRSTGLCGSEPYIAAEEFVSSDYLASPVDIWAAGIVYYTLVYRAIPWHRAETADARFAFYLESRRAAQHSPDQAPVGASPADAEGFGAAAAETGAPDAAAANGSSGAGLAAPGGVDVVQATEGVRAAENRETHQEQELQQQQHHRQQQQQQQQEPPKIPVSEKRGKPNLELFLRLSQDAARVLFRMLDPDPERRWTAHDIKRDPWFANVECCYECHRNERHGHKCGRAFNELRRSFRA